MTNLLKSYELILTTNWRTANGGNDTCNELDSDHFESCWLERWWFGKLGSTNSNNNRNNNQNIDPHRGSKFKGYASSMPFNISRRADRESSWINSKWVLKWKNGKMVKQWHSHLRAHWFYLLFGQICTKFMERILTIMNILEWTKRVLSTTGRLHRDCKYPEHPR